MERHRRRRSFDWLSYLELPDVEGLLALLAGLALFLAGWAAVDLLLPFAVLGAYLALVSALTRVANDRHDCEGNLGRSILWGAIWASVYTLPLAGFVWILHSLHR